MKVIDLFSGIGGFSLGLESTGGFETLQFVENNKWCQKVLAKNFPNVPITGDIRNYEGQEQADVVVGGFPCQPFSQAGKRKGKDDDRYLWDETLRVVAETKPEWFIGENVDGLVSIQDGMVLRQVQDDLEKEGFQVQCLVIPASSIGAWHQRFRVWIVGHSKHNGLLAAEKRSRDKKINGGTQEGQNQTIESERTSGSRNDENVSNTERKRLEGLSEQGTTLSRENERSQFGSTNSSRSSEDVPNSTILGSRGCRDSDQEEGREGCSSTQSDGKRSNVSNTISELSVGCSSTTRDSEKEFIRLECNEGWHWNQVRSEVERCSEQSKSTNRTWWQIESDLCGVPNGISRELDKDRSNRIKSLGNAIVPQCARILGLAIKQVLIKEDRE